MLASDLIKHFQKIVKENGDITVVAYKSFSKETVPINEQSIYLAQDTKKIEIGIYA